MPRCSCRSCREVVDVGHCPFDVPTAEWNTTSPRIRKCDFCASRIGAGGAFAEVNGAAPSADSRGRSEGQRRRPACAAACPTGALAFGERDDLLAEAWRRIRERPASYVPHVYGEREVGGTSWLYLSSVPFGSLGLPQGLPDHSLPEAAAPAMKAIPWAVVGVGVAVGVAYWFAKRREEIAAGGDSAPKEGP